MIPTLQQCISHLEALAKETNSELLHVIDLQCDGGALLVVYWTGPGNSLPLEAHLYFMGSGIFAFAFVYDAQRYIWAIDEGLTDQQAEDESRHMVDGFNDVCSYFTGNRYKFTSSKKGLDKER